MYGYSSLDRIKNIPFSTNPFNSLKKAKNTGHGLTNPILLMVEISVNS